MWRRRRGLALGRLGVQGPVAAGHEPIEDLEELAPGLGVEPSRQGVHAGLVIGESARRATLVGSVELSAIVASGPVGVLPSTHPPGELVRGPRARLVQQVAFRVFVQCSTGGTASSANQALGATQGLDLTPSS